MSNVFEGTGVKRYAIRYRKDQASPWEYTSAREYDTLEEARVALAELTGSYEIVEKAPVLRYVPGDVPASKNLFLRNVLAEMDFLPYMLQYQTKHRTWENRYDLQFNTLEEAQSVACTGTFRVTTATVDIQYNPVEVSGYE